MTISDSPSDKAMHLIMSLEGAVTTYTHHGGDSLQNGFDIYHKRRDLMWYINSLEKEVHKPMATRSSPRWSFWSIFLFRFVFVWFVLIASVFMGTALTEPGKGNYVVFAFLSTMAAISIWMILSYIKEKRV